MQADRLDIDWKKDRLRLRLIFEFNIVCIGTQAGTRQIKQKGGKVVRQKNSY